MLFGGGPLPSFRRGSTRKARFDLLPSGPESTPDPSCHLSPPFQDGNWKVPGPESLRLSPEYGVGSLSGDTFRIPTLTTGELELYTCTYKFVYITYPFTDLSLYEILQWVSRKTYHHNPD